MPAFRKQLFCLIFALGLLTLFSNFDQRAILNRLLNPESGRNTSILQCKATSIDRLEFSVGQINLRFKKHGGLWQINGEVLTEDKHSKFVKFLDNLEDLRIHDEANPDGVHDDEFGFKDAKTAMVYGCINGKGIYQIIQIDLGREAPFGFEMYVKLSSSGSALLVSKHLQLMVDSFTAEFY